MKSETTSLQLEIGKKYKVRNDRDIKYVEITGVYEGPINYDFEGRVVYKEGFTFSANYTSDGSVWSGGNDSRDLVEEYSEADNKEKP